MCHHGKHGDNPCVTKQRIFIMKKVLNPELKSRWNCKKCS